MTDMAYGTDADLIAYLAETGRVITGNVTHARIAASAYIDSFEDVYCGTAMSYDASWPRDGIDRMPDDVIPQRVINAVYEAAYLWDSNPNVFTYGGTSGGQVIKEKVDVIEVGYAAPSGDYFQDNRYHNTIIDGMLAPFLCGDKDAFGWGGWGFVV